MLEINQNVPPYLFTAQNKIKLVCKLLLHLRAIESFIAVAEKGLQAELKLGLTLRSHIQVINGNNEDVELEPTSNYL